MNRRQLLTLAPIPFVFATGIMDNDGNPFMLEDSPDGTRTDSLFYIYGRFGTKIDTCGLYNVEARPLSWEDIEPNFDREVGKLKADLKRYVEGFNYYKHKAALQASRKKYEGVKV